jgi:hypothetical protein
MTNNSDVDIFINKAKNYINFIDNQLSMNENFLLMSQEYLKIETILAYNNTVLFSIKMKIDSTNNYHVLEIPMTSKSSWLKTKKYIDILMKKKYIIDDCPVCYEEIETNLHAIPCKSCENFICCQCVVKMLDNETNSHFFSCPLCRHKALKYNLHQIT